MDTEIDTRSARMKNGGVRYYDTRTLNEEALWWTASLLLIGYLLFSIILSVACSASPGMSDVSEYTTQQGERDSSRLLPEP